MKSTKKQDAETLRAGLRLSRLAGKLLKQGKINIVEHNLGIMPVVLEMITPRKNARIVGLDR